MEHERFEQWRALVCELARSSPGQFGPGGSWGDRGPVEMDEFERWQETFEAALDMLFLEYSDQHARTVTLDRLGKTPEQIEERWDRLWTVRPPSEAAVGLRASRGSYRPLSLDLRARVFARDGLRCVSCGAVDDLSVDHVTPRSRGGDDSLSNLQTLCRSCNSRKGVSTL